MPITRWGIELPTAAELPAVPRGVVVHWTGGGHRATGVDREAYHYVVEGDGSIVVGRWPVAANMRKVSGSDYAAHTGGWNSYRVGIALAGMKGYTSPAAVGNFPLRHVQVERLAMLAGYFLELGGLDPMNPDDLCTHQEVWTIHRIKGNRNHQKLDIEHLPFRPELKPDQVGDYLREITRVAMQARPRIPNPSIVVPSPRRPSPELPRTEPKRPWWRRILNWR